jgi:hypothetical protein
VHADHGWQLGEHGWATTSLFDDGTLFGFGRGRNILQENVLVSRMNTMHRSMHAPIHTPARPTLAFFSGPIEVGPKWTECVVHPIFLAWQPRHLTSSPWLLANGFSPWLLTNVLSAFAYQRLFLVALATRFLRVPWKRTLWLLGLQPLQMSNGRLWDKQTEFELATRVPMIIKVPWNSATSAGRHTSASDAHRFALRMSPTWYLVVGVCVRRFVHVHSRSTAQYRVVCPLLPSAAAQFANVALV